MAMEKLTTKERSAGGSLHCRLMDSRLWILWDKDARVSNMTYYNTLAQDKGDEDYLSTRGAKGNRWRHFGNQIVCKCNFDWGVCLATARGDVCGADTCWIKEFTPLVCEVR